MRALLISTVLIISLFAQDTDSLVTADSLAPDVSSLRYPLLKPVLSPIKPSFEVNAPDKYGSGLKLGQPYVPKQDIQRMDLRQSPFYTPYLSKRLQLMDMGRDPGTVWVSPYSLAIMGFAMLERFYLHEKMVDMFTASSLHPAMLIDCEPWWIIIEALWKKAPQTFNELEADPAVGFRLRGDKLEHALKVLQKNSLIRSDILPNRELQYTFVYDQVEMRRIIVRMLDDPANTDLDIRDGLNQLMKHFETQKQ